MAKASRSRKSQPAFDPSELEDLILTPAVGSGVGSHLINTTIVDKIDMPTVVEETPEPAPDMTTVAIWITEQGEFVPASRVRRIVAARDVLSPAEEAIYGTLWEKGIAAPEGDARIAQAGYDYLMKQTRLSKKTVQRIIDRLIAKEFIAIERPADIYLRTSTVYRVFDNQAVLDRQARRGRFHAAKIGPGFVYARRLNR